ncbi:MAG: GNAT family N-acetyltransferase [bacterium]
MATLADVELIEAVIVESVHGLSSDDYSEIQRNAALGSAFGLDTQLINDKTYFVVEAQSQVIACGGWSKRKTLFGGDKQAGRQSGLLDPKTESARIRAFFVKPAWARLGIGRHLIELCEAEALKHGFSSAELVATLPGHRLYRACGYIGDEKMEYKLPGDIAIHFIPMRKTLA